MCNRLFPSFSPCLTPRCIHAVHQPLSIVSSRQSQSNEAGKGFGVKDKFQDCIQRRSWHDMPKSSVRFRCRSKRMHKQHHSRIEPVNYRLAAVNVDNNMSAHRCQVAGRDDFLGFVYASTWLNNNRLPERQKRLHGTVQRFLDSAMARLAASRITFYRRLNKIDIVIRRIVQQFDFSFVSCVHVLSFLWSVSLDSIVAAIMSQPSGIGNGPPPFSTGRARATVIICVVFLVLATMAVMARFWSRHLKRVKPALDDKLIVLGLIFYYCSAIQTILQVCIGRLGHHIYNDITSEQLVANGKVCGDIFHPAPPKD